MHRLRIFPIMIVQYQPGGLGNITIMDTEGNFLSELVDFVNTTVSRDLLLVVPGKGELPNWDGLQPNAKYVNRF